MTTENPRSAHSAKNTTHADGKTSWSCTCGKGSKNPSWNQNLVSAARSRHITVARAAEAKKNEEN